MRPATHPWQTGVGGLLGILLVAVVGLLVAHSQGWTAREAAVLRDIASVRSPASTALAQFIARLFGSIPAAGLTVLAAVGTWLATRSWARALVLVVMVIVGWGSTTVMKVLVARPRPDSAGVLGKIPSDFSYPSGHTAFACALVIAVLFTLRDWRYRWAAVGAGAVVVAVVGGSRMYLGVHYPSDVVAAVVLTVSSAAVVIPLVVNGILPWLGRHRRPTP